MSQAVATQQDTLPALIASREPEYRAALPANVNPDRFMRVLKDALNANPDLRNPNKANPRSVVDACAKAAKDGLVIDGREAALVLFKGTATYIPMVAGLRKLIFQSGLVDALDTNVVYENDVFKYRAGTNAGIDHEPEMIGDRGKPIAAYSIARMKSGGMSVEVMRWDDIVRIAKDTPVWRSHQGEMARKTVLRRHFKSLPSSAEAQQAFEAMDELYTNEAGETQPGEISEPTRKQAGGAAAALAARRQQPETAEPAHDPETGEIDDPESGGPTDAQFDPI